MLGVGDESRVASLGILDPMGAGVCVRRAGVRKVETKEHLRPYTLHQHTRMSWEHRGGVASWEIGKGG